MPVSAGVKEIVWTGEQDAEVRGGQEMRQATVPTVLLLISHLYEDSCCFPTSAEQNRCELCFTILWK